MSDFMTHMMVHLKATALIKRRNLLPLHSNPTSYLSRTFLKLFKYFETTNKKWYFARGADPLVSFNWFELDLWNYEKKELNFENVATTAPFRNTAGQ